MDRSEAALPRGVVVLGVTGSIGRQALDVIERHPDRLRLVGVSAGRDEDALNAIATRCGVEHRALGKDASVQLARIDEADVVLNAIVGAAGLEASLAALEAGKTLALANKESLVAGGHLCRGAAERGAGIVVPVDSEHSAIAQCLEGRELAEVDAIILTASGGPFRTRMDVTAVTPGEALAHPTWAMGPKITIDSATLMNKGLEVIEGHHLFGMEYDRIRVVVHPQSIVHGVVEMCDGSMVAQAAPTDMRIPIQAALTWPERVNAPAERIDLARLGRLDFEEPDHGRFPLLGLAYDAGRMGGTAPAVLNAANEVAVQAFLEERVGFTDIAATVAASLDAHEVRTEPSLEDVLAADSWARRAARVRIEGKASPSQVLHPMRAK